MAQEVTTSRLPFRAVRLRLRAEAIDEISLPAYPGSVFRGIYGAALRRISCMTGQRRCEGCPLLLTCPYPELFDPVPKEVETLGSFQREVAVRSPPYVIETNDPVAGTFAVGDVLEIGMWLYGRATNRISLIVEAWREALGRGIGMLRARAILRAAFVEEAFQPGGFQIYGESAETWDGEVLSAAERKLAEGNLSISLVTPLCLTVGGKPLRDLDPTPRQIAAAIVRRARLINAHAGTPAGEAVIATWPVDAWLNDADRVKATADIAWQNWRRYSSRQKRAMVLGGFTGRLTWENVSAGLGWLLDLGTVLHLGKETVFGFGQIRLDVPEG